MSTIPLLNKTTASQVQTKISGISSKKSSANSTASSFAALLAKSKSSTTLSRIATSSSTKIASNATAKTSTTTAATNTAGAGKKTATPEIVHTPFGEYDLNNLEPCGVRAEPPSDPMRLYFFTHAPGDYRNDPAKMAEFQRIHGTKAVAILNQWSRVPENVNRSIISTAADKAFFREDGIRSYFAVSDLINMTSEQRGKYVDISTEQLLNLYWNQQYDVTFTTKPNVLSSGASSVAAPPTTRA